MLRKYPMVCSRPSSSSTRGSHPSSVRARVMSGCRTFGSSIRQVTVDDAARRARHPDDRARDLLDRHLPRVADVDRVVHVGQHQPDDAVHQIGDVAEAARLRAVAENRDVLVPQRLRHERGHGASVVEPHPRAVGVEDADDLRVQRRGTGDTPPSWPRRTAWPRRTRRAGRSGSRCPSRFPSADARADRRTPPRWTRGRTRASFALASPSALCVPSAPTFSVGIGSSR